MLSRVASNIYWMARYLERAENTARLVNVNSHLIMDLPKGVILGWEPLIDIVSDSNREHYHNSYPQVDEKSVVKFLITDIKNPGSIISSLAAARENARTIREIIPREAWEQINTLYWTAKQNRDSVLTRRHRHDCLSKIVLGNQTITGMLSGTMTHDEGYAFLRVGRNIELADMTTRIIDVRSASLLPDLENAQSAFENLQWMGVLKSLTAYQMYRREMRLRISRPDVLKFLLQEDRFPRALAHAVMQIEKCLMELPDYEAILPTVHALHKQLMQSKPQKLQQEKLHEFIDELQLALSKIHDAVSERYF